MTKNEIREKLAENSGLSFAEAFPYEKPGRGCTIFKAAWPKEIEVIDHLDDVVYIPDITLNDMDEVIYKQDPTSDDVEGVLQYCYTVRDILFETYNNAALARDVYVFSNKQTPNIQELMDCRSAEEALADYGEDWDAMQERDRNISKARLEVYRLYQLDWLMQHGFSVYDIMDECRILAKDELDSLDTNELDGYDFTFDIEENGLGNGSLYVSFDEFLKCEYKQQEYIKEFIDRSPLNLDGTLLHWYDIDVNEHCSLDGRGPHLISTI